MTCEEALAQMAAESLTSVQEQALSDHLESCSRCELQLAEVDLSALSAWQTPEPADGLAQRTIERLHQDGPAGSAWTRFWNSVDRAIGRFATHRATPVSGFATVMVFLLLLVPVLSPHWARGRSSGSVSGCKVNLRLLGDALDSYARDHQGQYPPKLSELEVSYVKEFPHCPQAGVDTYRDGYQPSPDGRHFQLCCRGEHHRDAGLGPDQPSVQR